MNNNLHHAAKSYKNSVYSTSTRQTKQVVMLYDGILKFLNKTLGAVVTKDIQEKYNNTDKATKIITGLHACLDPVNGGEVTVILDKFYTGINFRIMKLNFEKDVAVAKQKCEGLIQEIQIMRDAWQEVDEKYVNGEIGNTTAQALPSEEDLKNNGFKFSI